MPRPPRRSLKPSSNGVRTGIEAATAISDASQTARCAIYTRKSTSEGLDQAFNSLDAQREAAEAYVASQRHRGWQALPNRYDDGGFSGGSIDRPAVTQLLADIEAGLIDCVVVYKVDRLSRSLLDFARLMSLFEQKNIHFVSVTQQFNTAESMGRLTLNILLSFAQFEREIIAERTRDKIAAARRRGQWVGGRPVLGYDLDRGNHKLMVNEDEKARVRDMFSRYLECQSLMVLANELNAQGATTKRWTDAKGHEHGGLIFTKTTLGQMLGNVVYLGKVRHEDDVYDGQHPAIIDEEVWNDVQAILDRNHRTAGSILRNKYGALLKGLLRCKACDAAMIHSPVTKGNRQYRYYVCSHAQKTGYDRCPNPSLSAASIEQAVLNKLKMIHFDCATVARSRIADCADLLFAGDDGIARPLQADKLQLLVERVDYDGPSGRMGIMLSPDATACVKQRATA